MDDPKEIKEGNRGWVSMPAFGDWDTTKNGPVPDYSMDFSKIREKRKQNRTTSRDSIGNDQEIITRHHSSGGNSHRESFRDAVYHLHHSRHSLGSKPKQTIIINGRCGSIAEWIRSNGVVLKTRKKMKSYLFNCFMVGA